MAEEERFELPVPCGTAVFKTAALDHSATPPNTDFLAFSRVGRDPKDGADLLFRQFLRQFGLLPVPFEDEPATLAAVTLWVEKLPSAKVPEPSREPSTHEHAWIGRTPWGR